MATDLVSLNRVKYGGLDFDTIEDDLRAQLQIKFAASFNDFSVSSLGIVLLDIVSFGLDTLSFYLDRRATDTYLVTARTRRSVALLTRQLGYKMGGAVAASVDLQVSTATQYAFPVPIPKGFQFLGPNNIIFEAAQQVTIPAFTTAPQKVPAFQGITTSENFVSDGTANQLFKLTRVPTDSSIVQGTVQVLVNGSPFAESDFVTFDATDQFEINYNDEPPTLRFGDGVAGNIPIKNGSIAVTYVASLGAAGQVLSHNIKKVQTQLVVLFTPINLVVDNPDNTVGGSDLEDLDHAKTYAPRVFKSRRVAVTRQDYEALAGSFADPLFGRVAVAQAISARSAASDLELQNLLIDISAALTTAVSTIQNALNNVTTGAFVLTTTIQTSNTQLQADLTNLLTKLNTINTNLASLLSTSRTIKSNSTELQNDQADAAAYVATSKVSVATASTSALSAITTVNAFATAPANPAGSQLTAPDKTALSNTMTNVSNNVNAITSNLNQIDALLTLINALAGQIGAGATSQTTVTQAIQSIVVNDIGISVLTANTIVKDMQTQITSIVTALGTQSPVAGLFGDLVTIQNSSDLAFDTVTADTAAIEVHVDKILSADCKANLVVVPILARDASGFYAAPSIGLVQSLQSLLDGVKEVTQTVAVTSGVQFLVPAAIEIRLAIRVGISEQITTASAITIVDGVLRDRSFGQSLYVSDLFDPLSTLPGVVFVNVTILGYRPNLSPVILVDKLDANGNLIIANSEVITLSQSDLDVNTELFAGSFA